MRARTLIGAVCLAMALGGQVGGSAQTTGTSIPDLERALADWRLGCGGCVARFGWNEHHLSVFVAGRLASLGFASELARTGNTWWVLVQAHRDGENVILPVLPGLAPLDRDGQFARGVFLGRIPWLRPGVPDPQFLAPDEILPRPANASPVVRVRVHPIAPEVGSEVWFVTEASDPDGRIVLFEWDFGDGEGSWASSPQHVYTSDGTYTVTLTVLDDRGATTSVTTVVTVTAPVPLPPGGGGGCGC